jgi:hypothetical protein
VMGEHACGAPTEQQAAGRNFGHCEQLQVTKKHEGKAAILRTTGSKISSRGYLFERTPPSAKPPTPGFSRTALGPPAGTANERLPNATSSTTLTTAIVPPVQTSSQSAGVRRLVILGDSVG